MTYKSPHILKENIGNNALSYAEREALKGGKPEIFIPALRDGGLDSIEIGDDIVFEEIENNELKSCKGLKYFVQLSNSEIPITIFDNHNHALYFWIDAIHSSQLQSGFELIHIDEHSDLWSNENTLDKNKAINDLNYAWEFTNFSCNVGNYIAPALGSGLIEKMIRIENDYQVDAFMDYVPIGNSVLNIDLDFFAPEMDFIDEEKKLKLIRNLMKKVGCITIATSPFFIDQRRAIEALHKIFSN